MPRDFTYRMYKDFLRSAIDSGYQPISFLDYLVNPQRPDKVIILRQDVDRRPSNALQIAKIQREFGAKGSYYFRIVRSSFNEKIIQEIASLGHEIGYHYEDLSRSKGNFDVAITKFQRNLEVFRKFYPVKTICMHGSPLSRFDNRSMWGKFDYKDYGILGEPYFDLDFRQVLYITDTGRQWNGAGVSIRDKVSSPFHYDFSSTQSLAQQLTQEHLPRTILQTIHPQRWNDNYVPWMEEFVSQNMKNVIKRILTANRRYHV